MYEDTYTKFNSKDFKYGQYSQTFIVNDPPYYECDYGDTFDLKFDVVKQIEMLPDYYDKAKIYIYNFRYELVCESEDISLEDKCKTIGIHIDDELSQKLIKGTYYCKVEATGQLLGGKFTRTTIIHPSNCILYVR